MSSLARYKKSGGFFQLLSLIETFGPDKKKKFLEMIEAESSVWATALREKMLTIERILGWPDQVMIEVFKNLQLKNLAICLEGIPAEAKARVLNFFSASEKRRISDTLEESSPKPEEVAATLVKLVEQARKMLVERQLHPDKFDVSLVIPEDYESKLEFNAVTNPTTAQGALSQMMMPATGQGKAVAPSAAESAQAAVDAATPSTDIIQLQKTLAILLKENRFLKEEVRNLKDRIEGIKKLAS